MRNYQSPQIICLMFLWGGATTMSENYGPCATTRLIWGHLLPLNIGHQSYMDSPGSVKLNQPQTVTLEHLLVEVGGVELNNIITGWVKGLGREDQGAAQHSWGQGRQHGLLNNACSNVSNGMVLAMKWHCKAIIHSSYAEWCNSKWNWRLFINWFNDNAGLALFCALSYSS